MSKKEKEATSKVLDYLTQQNRPYSLNDIFLNLHKEIGKTAVQKILDQLTESGSIKEKTYGKQKVYVVDQSKLPSLDEEKLRQMDATIAQLNEDIKEKSKEVGQLEATMKQLESSLTDDQLKKVLEKISNEITTLESKLVNLQEKRVFVSQQERERISFTREKMIKEWRKRRRIANDMLDAILEGYPKSKKELYEDIGIETDYDANVTIPAR